LIVKNLHAASSQAIDVAFREAADRLAEPMLVVAPDGEIHEANRRFLDLTGLPRESLRGRRLTDFSAQDADAVAAYLRLCARTPHMTLGRLVLSTVQGPRGMRCEGFLLRARQQHAGPLVLLRLSDDDAQLRPFAELKVHIMQLRREVQARRALEDELREVNRRLEAVNADLERLARTDELTGIANRRRFEEQFAEEYRRAQRAGTPLSLLMIDVDKFKQFNDHLGHQAGDRCLKRLATVIKRGLRRGGDSAARYGGEEFVVLLPQTDADGALQRARHFLDSVARLGIRHPHSPVADCVTVSIGVATVTPVKAGKSGPSHLLLAADRALYRAKRAGRNRISLHQPDPTGGNRPPRRSSGQAIR
jgi:diguanylate cyclase (GGDEF)-like protein